MRFDLFGHRLYWLPVRLIYLCLQGFGDGFEMSESVRNCTNYDLDFSVPEKREEKRDLRFIIETSFYSCVSRVWEEHRDWMGQRLCCSVASLVLLCCWWAGKGFGLKLMDWSWFWLTIFLVLMYFHEEEKVEIHMNGWEAIRINSIYLCSWLNTCLFLCCWKVGSRKYSAIN